MTQWIELPHSVHALVAERPNSILLQTSRFNKANQNSYCFIDPLQTLVVRRLEDLPRLFLQIEAAVAKGYHVAGYLSYECGYHFEPATHLTISHETVHGPPLAWFGIYSKPILFDHATGCFIPHTSDLAAASIQTVTEPFTDHVTLGLSKERYGERIIAIKELIAAGDTYQVNFTDRVSLKTTLPPAVAFATLLRQQPVAYAAFMNVAGHTILSLSPELFFKLEDGKITTRPMKGTMPRGLDLEGDERAALHLQHDEKNRSEHVMIVDLLRNDLGRICTMGSVQVEDLFTVERYETLLQMTSTVTGTLLPGLSFYEIFRGLFPSGSITGAPKIRTMQIIEEIESAPRGIYTGAIGFIAPDRSATFNVAIRTLILKKGQGEMGVGGGIVADSNPADEYRECLLKAAFLTRTADDFQLIETLRWDAEYLWLKLHLDRLSASAAYFHFPFNLKAITAQLMALKLESVPHRVRLLLDSSGTITLTAKPFVASLKTGLIRLSPQRTLSTDRFLRHKTTRRTLYDQEYARAIADGFDEVLFLNERGEITEGAISNIFVRKDGRLLTPPLSSGVLPGIHRRHLLETSPEAEERILTLEDLSSADSVFLCNSLRGISEVRLELRPI